jgi:hypothetical protein
MNPDAVAEKLHELGRELSPEFGIRPGEPWDELPSGDRRLLCAIVDAALADGTILDSDEKQIMDDVLVERGIQERMWGPQHHDPSVWMVILARELGHVSGSMLKARFQAKGQAMVEDVSRELRAHLVKVAAIAQAAIVDLDRSS